LNDIVKQNCLSLMLSQYTLLLITILESMLDIVVVVKSEQDAFYVLIILMIAIQVTRKILILREIPEDRLPELLSNQDCLAACDVAVFVYDRWGAR